MPVVFYVFFAILELVLPLTEIFCTNKEKLFTFSFNTWHRDGQFFTWNSENELKVIFVRTSKETRLPYPSLLDKPYSLSKFHFLSLHYLADIVTSVKKYENRWNTNTSLPLVPSGRSFADSVRKDSELQFHLKSFRNSFDLMVFSAETAWKAGKIKIVAYPRTVSQPAHVICINLF